MAQVIPTGADLKYRNQYKPLRSHQYEAYTKWFPKIWGHWLYYDVPQLGHAILSWSIEVSAGTKWMNISVEHLNKNVI